MAFLSLSQPKHHVVAQQSPTVVGSGLKLASISVMLSAQCLPSEIALLEPLVLSSNFFPVILLCWILRPPKLQTKAKMIVCSAGHMEM